MVWRCHVILWPAAGTGRGEQTAQAGSSRPAFSRAVHCWSRHFLQITSSLLVMQTLVNHLSATTNFCTKANNSWIMYVPMTFECIYFFHNRCWTTSKRSTRPRHFLQWPRHFWEYTTRENVAPDACKRQLDADQLIRYTVVHFPSTRQPEAIWGLHETNIFVDTIPDKRAWRAGRRDCGRGSVWSISANREETWPDGNKRFVIFPGLQKKFVKNYPFCFSWNCYTVWKTKPSIHFWNYIIFVCMGCLMRPCQSVMHGGGGDWS